MSDNKLIGTDQIEWTSDDIKVMTILIQERVKGMRISELNSETLKKKVGEQASKLMISREALLNVTKVIVRQILSETLSELEKTEFSK